MASTPRGFQVIGGMLYRMSDRSGPWVVDGDGNPTLINAVRIDELPLPVLQRVSPISGGTVVANQTYSVTTLLIEGTSTLTSLTIVLPQPGASRPGQIVRIVTLVDIDTLVFSGAIVGGAPSQMLNGDGISLQNIEDNTWLRLPQ